MFISSVVAKNYRKTDGKHGSAEGDSKVLEFSVLKDIGRRLHQRSWDFEESRRNGM